MVYRLPFDFGHLEEVRRRAPWLSPITQLERLPKAQDQCGILGPLFQTSSA